MNRLFKYIWLPSLVISVTAHTASADDLFDDSLFADPAPVEAPKTETPTTAAAPEISTTAEATPAFPESPADTASAEPEISFPAPEPVDAASGMDFSAPAMDLNAPPPSLDAPAGSSMSNMEFGGTNNDSTFNLTQRPSEQVVGKISNDVFREMAEMERENTSLMLQLKREQLRSEIDALKTSNRQILFDEIERREKMTQARLEWELAQDLKRQEALERKQRAEIRQKQIEAALKREEDRRVQKMKDEEAARLKKEEEEKKEKEKKQEEMKKKYDAISMVKVNDWKPIMIAATRPAKIKRTASSRVATTLTAMGEDLLAKKKAGEALTVEIPVSDNPDNSEEGKKTIEPASSLYAVSEIRGTSGVLIAKLISKKDQTSFFAKQSTILPTGHTVINIDKDFVLVKLGNATEMIGFPSAGLLTNETGDNSSGDKAENNEEGDSAPRTKTRAARKKKRQPSPLAQTSGSGPMMMGASLAK